MRTTSSHWSGEKRRTAATASFSKSNRAQRANSCTRGESGLMWKSLLLCTFKLGRQRILRSGSIEQRLNTGTRRSGSSGCLSATVRHLRPGWEGTPHSRSITGLTRLSRPRLQPHNRFRPRVDRNEASRANSLNLALTADERPLEGRNEKKKPYRKILDNTYSIQPHRNGLSIHEPDSGRQQQFKIVCCICLLRHSSFVGNHRRSRCHKYSRASRRTAGHPELILISE